MMFNIKNVFEKNKKKRQTKDIFTQGITYLFSSFGILVLLAILIFIFKNGTKLLKPKLLVSDYHSKVYSLKMNTTYSFNNSFKNPKLNNSFFSTKWGISLKDSHTQQGEKIVVINYIDNKSPFNSLTSNETSKLEKIILDSSIQKLILSSDTNDFILLLPHIGAKSMIDQLDSANFIKSTTLYYGGGGIRSSLITTLILIGLTLVVAMPIGIISAIYLHEYAPKNKFTSIIRSLIDMTNGIPSIIFGLVGAMVFIPFANTIFGSNGGSLISGALTLTIILLPTIIKTTEETLKTIPKSYRHASLALGASQTQTVFKVVLPSSIGGILTATLLSIGRIIGESAALIYAIGTVIKDSVSITDRSTSLAVHIWSLMSGENPNFELSSSIAIIILIIVLVLSILVKVISKYLDPTRIRKVKKHAKKAI